MSSHATPPESPAPPPPETVIRLRSHADVVVTLPYHLGYRPTDSLVVIGLHGPHPATRLGFVARVDLPEWGEEPWPTVSKLAPLVLAQRPDRVLLVAYEDRAGRAEPLGAGLRGVLTDVGVDVAERLVVRGERFFGPDCPADCCPPEGVPVPAVEDVPAVADYVLLGRRPLARREDLADLVAPTGSDDLLEGVVALSHLFQDPSAHAHGRVRLHAVGSDRLRRRALTAWAALVSTPVCADGEDPWSPTAPAPRGPGPACSTMTLLASSLRDVELRDLVITWWCPGSIDLDRLDPPLVALAREVLPGWPGHDTVLGPRLAALCRATPPAAAAAPLTVAANLAWWHGDGALARSALDLALAQEPDYRLALLLQRMLDLAIPPRRAA